MGITEYEENERFGARWHKLMAAIWTSRLTRAPEGRRLDFEIDISPPLLMQLFNPFLKGWVEKEMQAMLASFKARVERARLTRA